MIKQYILLASTKLQICQNFSTKKEHSVLKNWYVDQKFQIQEFSVKNKSILTFKKTHRIVHENNLEWMNQKEKELKEV